MNSKHRKTWIRAKQLMALLVLLNMSVASVYALDLADYENTATVSTSDSFDDEPDNNSSTIQVEPQVTLRVVKELLPSGDTGQFIMNANGALGAVGGDGADSSALVVIGDTATFSEAGAAGTDLANYVSEYQCVNALGSVITSGTGTSGSFVMPTTDVSNVTCTITNTRRVSRLVLAKSWINALVGEQIRAEATGLTNNATVGSVADTPTEIDTGTPVAVFAGETATISAEQFAVPANAANYVISDWVCDDAANSTVVAGGTLDITAADEGNLITCTITNEREAARLQLAKSWINALVGEEIRAGTTGLTNNANVGSVADTPTEIDTGTAVAVFPGDSATISAEQFAVPANAANYTISDWVCDDSANSTVVAGGTLNITAADSGNVITCTITNERPQATLTIEKDWVNANIGDQVGISTTGATNNVAFIANADSATETDVDPSSYTVFAGETLSFSEVFNSGNASDYTSQLTCSGANDANPNDGLLIDVSDTAITCTYTNARTTIVLNKIVTNNNGGNALDTDFTPSIDAVATSWGTAVPVSVGAHIASETNLAGYVASDWSGDCAADGTITVTAGQAAVCSITNDDTAPQLTLIKDPTNNNGGNAMPDDFMLTVAEQL